MVPPPLWNVVACPPRSLKLHQAGARGAKTFGKGREPACGGTVSGHGPPDEQVEVNCSHRSMTEYVLSIDVTVRVIALKTISLLSGTTGMWEARGRVRGLLSGLSYRTHTCARVVCTRLLGVYSGSFDFSQDSVHTHSRAPLRVPEELALN